MTMESDGRSEKAYVETSLQRGDFVQAASTLLDLWGKADHTVGARLRSLLTPLALESLALLVGPQQGRLGCTSEETRVLVADDVRFAICVEEELKRRTDRANCWAECARSAEMDGVLRDACALFLRAAASDPSHWRDVTRVALRWQNEAGTTPSAAECTSLLVQFCLPQMLSHSDASAWDSRLGGTTARLAWWCLAQTIDTRNWSLFLAPVGRALVRLAAGPLDVVFEAPQWWNENSERALDIIETMIAGESLPGAGVSNLLALLLTSLLILSLERIRENAQLIGFSRSHDWEDASASRARRACLEKATSDPDVTALRCHALLCRCVALDREDFLLKDRISLERWPWALCALADTQWHASELVKAEETYRTLLRICSDTNPNLSGDWHYPGGEAFLQAIELQLAVCALEDGRLFDAQRGLERVLATLRFPTSIDTRGAFSIRDRRWGALELVGAEGYGAIQAVELLLCCMQARGQVIEALILSQVYWPIFEKTMQDQVTRLEEEDPVQGPSWVPLRGLLPFLCHVDVLEELLFLIHKRMRCISGTPDSISVRTELEMLKQSIERQIAESEGGAEACRRAVEEFLRLRTGRKGMNTQ